MKRENVCKPTYLFLSLLFSLSYLLVLVSSHFVPHSRVAILMIRFGKEDDIRLEGACLDLKIKRGQEGHQRRGDMLPASLRKKGVPQVSPYLARQK